jgi:microcystin-dependent protein
MSEAFIGEIRMFAGNFAPRGWAFCDGQLLAVSQNDALFSLFGTIYGGDGRTTFGLPDMRGRVPIHAGSGPGLTPRQIGRKGGAENVTLTVNELPSHTHPLQGATTGLLGVDPAGSLPGQTSVDLYADNLHSPVNLHNDAVTPVGGSQRHTNLSPFLAVNFIVALFGVYPSRT